MTAPNHAAPARRALGFTLIELLVTISIIAVLIGILLPAMSAVRTAARSTATSSTMRNIRVAIDGFIADNGRAPGFFPIEEMASEQNGGKGAIGGTLSVTDITGFTSMENVLLDIAFNAVETKAQSPLPSPAADNSVIDIDPSQTGDEDLIVRLDTSLAGSTNNGAYLSLDGDHLAPIYGQVGRSGDPTSYSAQRIDNLNARGDTIIGMPDIIDDFGQPVLLWRRDTSAALPPRQFGVSFNADPRPAFASVNLDTSSASTTDETRASFYWATNAGYLASGVDDTFAPSSGVFGDGPIGLGDKRIRQALVSCLGFGNTDGSTLTDTTVAGGSADRVLASMMGALGHPKFGSDADSMSWPMPAAARGDIVLISAGADRSYFRRRFQSGGRAADGESSNVVGYEPREAAKAAGIDGGTAADAAWNALRTPAEFDDLQEATGG